MINYLVRASEFFNGLGFKKGTDKSYYHRWAYEVCLHTKEQKFNIRATKNIECANTSELGIIGEKNRRISRDNSLQCAILRSVIH